jgi:DNA mismatch endonuclease (patch repair protein)
MADHLTPEQRSANMRAIKGRNTKPELQVRSMLHRMGYRFTVNGPKNRKLPGKPDIVLPRYNTVIFVHGCFWHRHKGCKNATTPSSNVEFWQNKFEKNVANDRKNQHLLKKQGWNVIVIWECQLKTPEKVMQRLEKRLREQSPASAKIIPYPVSQSRGLKAAEARTPFSSSTKKRNQQ